MSVTTTQNARISTVREVLADYELHHSDVNPQPEVHQPAPAPNARQERGAFVNPPDWDYEHRRVPPYRPINHELNTPERNTYTSTIEGVFIHVMFGGVQMQGRASRLWRATGERLLGPDWFRYRIGGEW